GIRDRNVTGVQTCALPILVVVLRLALVVVAVVLELQGQRLPGRLVGDAAEEAYIAGKHLLEAELAPLITARVALPHVEMVARDRSEERRVGNGRKVPARSE